MNTDDESHPKENWRSRCEKLVGSLLESMLKSAEATESYLTHPEVRVRAAARLVKRHYWGDIKAGREGWASFCNRLAGPALVAMLESVESTRVYLTADTPELRIAALVVAREYWKSQMPCGNIFEIMAQTDPNPEVRRTALTSLCFHYINTQNSKILEILAKIVRDETKDHMSRFLAYRGLFMVEGHPFVAWPRFLDARDGLGFPERVDWNFVDRFLAGER